jgi:cell division protein FtsW
LILLRPISASMSVALIVMVMVFAGGPHYLFSSGSCRSPRPDLSRARRRVTRRRRSGSWQIRWRSVGHQSLIAVGTAGLWPRVMAGAKPFYPPEPYRFHLRCHQRGGRLIGATGSVCFCVIAGAAAILVRAEDPSAFVALGLTTMIAAQALVYISVVLGLMPTKGIPLPLVSAGGSSLLINLLGMGVLLNISQHESADA